LHVGTASGTMGESTERGGVVRLFAVACLVVLVSAACGDSESSTASTTVPGATATTIDTTATPTTAGPATTGPTSTAQPSTTVDDTTTSTGASTTTTGRVGEPYDFWVPVPAEGPVVGVIGVQYDDTLNVRSGPGISFPVIATLDPTQTGIAGTGQGWQLPSGSVWWEIESDGIVGWSNQRFLSRLGGVEDVTSFVVDRLGEIPVADTMLDLGLTVAQVFADPDVGSDVVVSVAPTVGDLGEVTYDVVGLGDDSVGGTRLHVFGQPSESGEGFSLMAVEATSMCQRGVSQGLCA